MTAQRARRLRAVLLRLERKGYLRLDPANTPADLSPEERGLARERLEETITDLAFARPDIAIERQDDGTVVLMSGSWN